MKVTSFCMAAMAIAFAGSASAAVYNVDSFIEHGTLYEDAGNTDDENSTVTIDYWVFKVATSGDVTIDVLSDRVLDGDWGDDGLSNLDTFLRLYCYDPEGDLGLLGAETAIADDDTEGKGLGDGSITSYDSFMETYLMPGTYVLAISEWLLSASEGRSGVNETYLFESSWGDYQLSFSGIDLPDQELPPVPLPAALPMLLAGLGGLAFAARRRR